MSKKTITIAVNEIRKMHEELAREAKEEAAKESAEHASYVRERSATLTYELYRRMHDKIYESCGVGDDTLQVSLINERFPETPEHFVEYVRGQTGLNIQAAKAKEQLFTDLIIDVDLNSPAKVCGYYCNRQSKELDFPDLLRENANRNRLWKEFLSGFAERIIGNSRQCLEEMPNKIYGIDEETTILHDKSTAFGGSFEFYNVRVSYYRLTDQQVTDLTAEINARVSHGNFTIKRADSCLWVYIKRAPDKIVDNPTFDFKEFYDKYDQVTDELKAVFHHINDNLKFADADNQIQTMKLDQKLYYWFSDGDLKFADVKEHLANSPHLQDLIDELNRLHPELLIKKATFQNREVRWASPRGCARGVDSLDERIEFEYEVVDKKSEFLAPRREVEEVMDQITGQVRNVRKIASALVESILYEVQVPGVLHRIIECDYEPNRIDNQMLRIEISIKGKKWLLDFNEIEHEVLLIRVGAEIEALTDNLLHVDFTNKQYQLNFAK